MKFPCRLPDKDMRLFTKELRLAGYYLTSHPVNRAYHRAMNACPWPTDGIICVWEEPVPAVTKQIPTAAYLKRYCTQWNVVSYEFS